MHKKLVQHNGAHFLQVDPVRLKRTAIRLRDEIISKIKYGDDIYKFYIFAMPVIDAAIRGEITQSLDLEEQQFIPANYRHDRSEGILPPAYDASFSDAVSDFRVTAEALSLRDWDPIIIDGLTYGWVEFEDEGDWLDKVERP